MIFDGAHPVRMDLELDLDLDVLATALADDGPATHEAAIAIVVARARRVGIALPALDVLADRTRPDVMRQRAFAAVHRALVVAPVGSGRDQALVPSAA